MTMWHAQALLSNAFAWMRKSSEDKLDGMVALLQKARALVSVVGPALQTFQFHYHPMGHLLVAAPNHDSTHASPVCDVYCLQACAG